MSTEIATPRRWQDIAPADAVDLDLSTDLTIQAPLNEDGERCPWPWGPQQRLGVPIGQYHCEYCGAMVLAGIPHIDYRDQPDSETCDRCDGTADCHQVGCDPHTAPTD